MRRRLPLLGAALVLALALSSAAGADTFRVERPHTSGGGTAVTFAPSSNATAIPFTTSQTGPMSFDALRSIWQAAGSTYGIPWEVLAAINKVETNFGQNLGPSSAGAVGWMQFMPSTWARWGIDANGDGVADPDNPTDAIFSAARYLAGCGCQFNISAAVYCYNHAHWYVREVMGLAAQYGSGGGAGVLSAASIGLVSPAQRRTQLRSARNRISSSRTQLTAAVTHAGNLGRSQRRLLRVAATSSLLTDRLDAQKRAFALGARRRAAEARATQLRKELGSARVELSQVRSEAVSGPSTLATSSPQLLSSDLFSYGGGAVGSAPYSGVVSIAMQYLGIPYVWGGSTPSGFDCSGLVKYVFAQVGVSLPHYTVAQWNYPNAVSVPRNQLEPGDLVFFNGLDHVGLYIGNGDIIDSPHTGAAVRIDSLSEPWYASKYDGAKRIMGAMVDGLPQTGGGATSFTTGSAGSFSSNVIYFTH
jgi:cell wall-associated NlpC family hydrolase